MKKKLIIYSTAVTFLTIAATQNIFAANTFQVNVKNNCTSDATVVLNQNKSGQLPGAICFATSHSYVVKKGQTKKLAILDTCSYIFYKNVGGTNVFFGSIDKNSTGTKTLNMC